MSDLCVTVDSEKLIYKRKLRFSETAQALISYLLNKLRLYGQTLFCMLNFIRFIPFHKIKI